MAKRRRRPFLRALLGVVLVLIVVVAGAALAAALLIDANAFKPEIAAAVERATGRALLLRGPIRVAFGLPPYVVAEDLALANAPGGSRPEMLHLARIEARVALLPLLTGEVDVVRLDLVQPDLLLETDAAGHGNWQPTPKPPAAAPAPPGGTAPSHPAPAARLRLAVGAVHVTNGRVVWHNGQTGQTATVLVPRLDASAAAPGSSVLVNGDLVSNGRTLALSGEVGPAAQLFDFAPGAPWPLELVLQGEGMRLAVRGTLTTAPGRGAGYALQVDAAATDPASIAPFLPFALPPLHDATLAARLTDTGAAWPEVRGVALHVAGLDLSTLRPGLSVVRADLTAPDLHRPAAAETQVALGAATLHLRGTFGALAPLLQAAAAPVPVELAAEAAAGPGAAAMQLHAALTVVRTPRPAIRGSVTAQRLDLDALLAALASPPPTPSAAGPPPPPRVRLIPDRPIDLAPLREADADVQIGVAALQTGGATYSGVTGHLVLQDGRLLLDPFAGQTPGGRLEARLSVDAADAAAPPMTVMLHAPALALGPLAAAFGYAGAIDGTAAVDADLKARGASPHALAASVSGHMEVGATDADVDNALLAAAFGGVLRAAHLPEAVLGGAGRTRLRCLTARLDAADGTVTVTTLLADTGRLLVQGGGTVALGQETLNLHLRPLLRIGPGLIVPVRVGGTLLEPKPALDSGNAARAGPSGDTCGATGSTEAEPPAKPMKPLDMLRSLLSH